MVADQGRLGGIGDVRDAHLLAAVEAAEQQAASETRTPLARIGPAFQHMLWTPV